MNSLIAGVILILCLSSYFFGRSEARKLVTQNIKLKALPAYYGYYLSLWCGLPALIIFGCWSLFEPTIIKVLILNNFPQIESKDLFYQQTLSFFNGNFSGEITNEIKAASIKYSSINIIAQNSKIVIIAAALIGSLTFAYRKIQKNNKARDDVEIILKVLLFTSSLVAILTTVGIIVSLLFESLKFFSTINIFEFIFGTSWSPQRAFVRDASAITPEELLELQDAFGSVPLFAGTAFIALIAMCVAVPIGLFSGIYLAEYSKGGAFSRFIRFGVNVLAGVPSIIAGVFIYALIVSTKILFGSMYSGLAGGMALSILMLPTVIKTTDEGLKLVPNELRYASLGVGASMYTTILKVTLPSAFRSIATGVVLGIARAAGETAPLIFTALFSYYYITGFGDLFYEMGSLSVLIYNFALEPYDAQNKLAWAASFILVLSILSVNIFSKILAAFNEKTKRV